MTTESLDIARRIAIQVREAGGRALIVGGWVRDRLLNTPTKDVDVEVFGIAAGPLRALLEQIAPVNTVGESFTVYKVGDVDVSLPRRESKAGRGHRGFAVTGDPALTIEEATRRRDFTINAILWDPLNDEYLDPFGGRADLLERRLLEAVDLATFGEDSLRVLRGVQFAARFDLPMEEQTRALCRSTSARRSSGRENLGRSREAPPPFRAAIDRVRACARAWRRRRAVSRNEGARRLPAGARVAPRR